jgi:hypothetical protein
MPSKTSFIRIHRLGLTHYSFPTIRKTIQKNVKTITITTSTNRKNRKHGKPNNQMGITFLLNKNVRNKFKAVCLRNGKGMSEVIDAFMLEYIKECDNELNLIHD